MPKIRGIKPETWTDDKFVRLSPLARLLFMGMWNLACDNGHVEDNLVQLKIRLLPMDSCDVGELIEEMIQTGQVERHDGYLKVVKLPEHQKIDLFWLTLCEWCEHDERTAFTPADRKGRKRGASQTPDGHKSGTSLAPDSEVRGGEVRGDEVRGGDSAGSPEPTRRDDVERLCTHLANRVAANGSKRPTVGKGWRDAARLMLDRDGRTEEQVRRAIDWSQDDEFWRSNILSMPKLREKYDQLRLQAQRDGSNVHHLPARDDQGREVLPPLPPRNPWGNL